jgi:hypothetical protein
MRIQVFDRNGIFIKEATELEIACSFNDDTEELYCDGKMSIEDMCSEYCILNGVNTEIKRSPDDLKSSRIK